MKKIQLIIIFIFFLTICYSQNDIIKKFNFPHLSIDTSSMNFYKFYIDSISIGLEVNQDDCYRMFRTNGFDTITNPCMNNEAIKIYLGQLGRIIQAYESGIELQEYCYQNLIYLTGLEHEPLFKNNNIEINDERILFWEDWIKLNYEKICWYKNKNFIYIRK